MVRGRTLPVVEQRPLQALFFFRVLFAFEPDFLLTVRRRAGFDNTSVFAATVPKVDPIVRAKFTRRLLSFLAVLLTRLVSILIS
jgi:hypothetical protein